MSKTYRIGVVYIYPEDWNVKDWFIERATGRTEDTLTIQKKLFKKYGKSIVEKDLRSLGFRNIKFRWSVKAGCSCGCSPGFIIRASHRQIPAWFNPNRSGELNYWLTFKHGLEVHRRGDGIFSKFVPERKWYISIS